MGCRCRERGGDARLGLGVVDHALRRGVGPSSTRPRLKSEGGKTDVRGMEGEWAKEEEAGRGEKL